MAKIDSVDVVVAQHEKALSEAVSEVQLLDQQMIETEIELAYVEAMLRYYTAMRDDLMEHISTVPELIAAQAKKEDEAVQELIKAREHHSKFILRERQLSSFASLFRELRDSIPTIPDLVSTTSSRTLP